MSDMVPAKRKFRAQNAPFEPARGTGAGGRKGGIPAAERAWQERGGHGVVEHVSRYRMVRFGRNLTQVEGAGGHTVKSRSSCQFVMLPLQKRFNTVQDYFAKWGPLLAFSGLKGAICTACWPVCW